MLFSSWTFVAAFLPVTWAGFWFLQRGASRQVALLWLVAASLFFYGWFKPAYLLILLVSLAFNFGVGTLLARPRMRGRKALLVFGIAANLAALACYKYAGLFFETLNALGGGFSVPQILLPLAISFFTFQKIAWLVDSYRRETQEPDFLHYSLFIVFFPQLIAGPIVHHRELIPQFMKSPGAAALRRMLAAGLTVFVFGLFKKVAIADHMGEVADPVFTAAALGSPLTAAEAWLGALAYTVQIYFDFSGYSDMAVGLAAMFGVRLPLNFYAPYRAADIVEFWRRWHITLSRFLRDYLYIPLGGNRRGPARRTANLMLTMLLGGLWHGAGWTFAVWGGLHGLYLVACHAWKGLSPWRMPRLLGVLVTFMAVLLAWVFFRAGSMDAALHMLSCMAGENGLTVTPMNASRLLRINEKWHVLWIALALAWFAPTMHDIMRGRLSADITGVADRAWMKRIPWRPALPWAAAAGVAAALSLLLLHRVNAFIYFQF